MIRPGEADGILTGGEPVIVRLLRNVGIALHGDVLAGSEGGSCGAFLVQIYDSYRLLEQLDEFIVGLGVERGLGFLRRNGGQVHSVDIGVQSGCALGGEVAVTCGLAHIESRHHALVYRIAACKVFGIFAPYPFEKALRSDFRVRPYIIGTSFRRSAPRRDSDINV